MKVKIVTAKEFEMEIDSSALAELNTLSRTLTPAQIMDGYPLETVDQAVKDVETAIGLTFGGDASECVISVCAEDGMTILEV